MRLDHVDSLPAYLDSFRQEISARVQMDATPLHDPATDPVHADLVHALRKPYPAQAHAITALAKTLKTESGTYVCGEMGTGKTLIGSLVPWIMRHDCRVMVLCPGHLTRKWKREIEKTIPDAEVKIIEKTEDCRTALYLDTNKPQYWILSKETAKLGYYKQPAVKTKAVDVQVYNTTTGTTRVETQLHCYCPDCGTEVTRPPKAKDDIAVPVLYPDLAKNPTKYRCRGPRNPRADRDPGYRGRRTANRRPDKNTGQPVPLTCNNPLYGPDRTKTRKLAIADYLKRRGARFDMLIADEVHELKGSDTAQGNALGKLGSCSDKVLALTGTLIGGYSSHLFCLNYRMDAASMKKSGFKYHRTDSWVDKYGVRETISRETTSPDSSNSRSHGTKTGTRTASAERPGISPALFADQLLGNSVFLHLEDVARQLPPLTERPIAVDMSPDLYAGYRKLESDIKAVMAQQLARGNKKLLGRYLVNLLSYPDKPFNNEPVPLDKGAFAFPTQLSETVEYPKESELARICQEAHRRGRKTLVFLTYTGKRDTAPRVKQTLEAYGLRCRTLYAQDVPPKRREEWINEISAETDCLITNPETVKTGLDLIMFPTIVYIQTGYNVFTLRQSSRRSWRIGQTQPVEIYYLYYVGTMQARAVSLIGKKLSASQALDGKLSSEGLQALAGEDADDALALARALCEGHALDSGIEDTWSRLNEQNADLYRYEPADDERDGPGPREDAPPAEPVNPFGSNAPDMAALAGLEEGTPAFQKALDRIAHDLMPNHVKAIIPPLYSQEKAKDAIAYVKLFTPDGQWTWYITEYSDVAPDDTPESPSRRLAFGLVDGHEAELGYISIAELEGIKGPMGLKVERDLWFEPAPLSVIREQINNRRGFFSDFDPEPPSTPDPAAPRLTAEQIDRLEQEALSLDRPPDRIPGYTWMPNRTGMLRLVSDYDPIDRIEDQLLDEAPDYHDHDDYRPDYDESTPIPPPDETEDLDAGQTEGPETSTTADEPVPQPEEDKAPADKPEEPTVKKTRKPRKARTKLPRQTELEKAIQPPATPYTPATEETRKLVIAQLDRGPLSLDDLCRFLATDRPTVAAALLELELCGEVTQHPGKVFSLKGQALAPTQPKADEPTATPESSPTRKVIDFESYRLQKLAERAAKKRKAADSAQPGLFR